MIQNQEFHLMNLLKYIQLRDGKDSGLESFSADDFRSTFGEALACSFVIWKVSHSLIKPIFTSI